MVGSLSSPGTDPYVHNCFAFFPTGEPGLATVHRIQLRNISTFFLGIKVLFVLPRSTIPNSLIA